jgi:hypothetical protein
MSTSSGGVLNVTMQDAYDQLVWTLKRSRNSNVIKKRIG